MHTSHAAGSHGQLAQPPVVVYEAVYGFHRNKGVAVCAGHAAVHLCQHRGGCLPPGVAYVHRRTQADKAVGVGAADMRAKGRGACMGCGFQRVRRDKGRKQHRATHKQGHLPPNPANRRPLTNTSKSTPTNQASQQLQAAPTWISATSTPCSGEATRAGSSDRCMGSQSARPAATAGRVLGPMKYAVWRKWALRQAADGREAPGQQQECG